MKKIFFLTLLFSSLFAASALGQGNCNPANCPPCPPQCCIIDCCDAGTAKTGLDHAEKGSTATLCGPATKCRMTKKQMKACVAQSRTAAASTKGYPSPVAVAGEKLREKI